MKEMNCIIRDINFKGMQICLAQRLPKDTLMKISLTLCAELGCINLELWMVWHKRIMESNVYGLYFAKIMDSDKENIYKFLRKYFPDEMNKKWWKGTKEKGGEEEMMAEKVNGSKDRRIFERFVAKFPLRFIDLFRSKEGEAQVHDVSAKGIGIVAQNEIPMHTPLEMWLDIPDRGEPIHTRGEVMWSRQDEPGKWRSGVNLEKADLMGISRVLRT